MYSVSSTFLHWRPRKLRLILPLISWYSRQILFFKLTSHLVFTVITQLSSTPALEVLDRNGAFVSVPPKAGTIIINIGDFLERISNEVFRSAIHRVVNLSPEERFSLAYFFDADPEAWIEPLASCVGNDERPRFERVRAGDWQSELLLMPKY